MMLEKEYPELFETQSLQHIPEASSYNHNYYIGVKGGILYAKSDDDNTTEWWITDGINSGFLGESYCSEGDRLHRFDSQQS